MGSVVYCIHYKDGCKWSDELRKLQGHLNTCKYDAIPCPKLCPASIPRVLMEDHLTYTCPKRIKYCDYCNEYFSAEDLENHTAVCQVESIYCENKCGSIVQRQFLKYHQSNECVKRLVPCRYCQKMFVFDTLKNHKSKCPLYPLACPNQCGETNICRQDMETHLNQQCDALTIECAYRDVGCSFKGSQTSLDKHVEEDTKRHLKLMCAALTKQQYQITKLCAVLHDLHVNTTGTLVWKITNYSKKLKAAKLTEDYELCSSSFYTSQYGYKLMVTLFPNGNGTGLDTHLSIYIKLIPGEYDAILPWPFSLPITFTLYDQPDDPQMARNVCESFIPDPSWKNFQKPSGDPDELGYGFPRFVSHDLLFQKSYIRNDALFLKIKVEDLKVFAV
ncbi:TNF receptor-associated factor 4-like [Centruroides sculpturatus]|uniref:TNF receptor-associated factor 4-like n=1 Tax=Centruroides sculpturatus TaxID=218467 RepID=UPI000C6E9729|nr:TNF receptor-associated factor 4-like [Centruroides sculpturatus]